MTHVARGLDSDGALLLDILVNGYVLQLHSPAEVAVKVKRHGNWPPPFMRGVSDHRKSTDSVCSLPCSLWGVKYKPLKLEMATWSLFVIAKTWKLPKCSWMDE